MEEYQELSFLEEFQSADDGLNAILKFRPDLVIMNLDQQAATLFEMCRELPLYLDNTPLIIGVANSTDHAYQAVKHQFFDYWLFPYNEYDIRKSILKLKKRFPKPEVAPTLLLQSYKDYQYLDTSEILYLQADNNTTDFIMRDGSRISAYKTLKTFEEQLPENFIRIHQSYILNRDYVSRIHYGKNRCFLKHVQTELPFSRGYRNNVDALKALLTQRALQRD